MAPPQADESARRAFELLSALLADGGPQGPFLMTARHESARRGLLVRRVMTCADAPPSVCVSFPKGHPISPLVRDSRGFALCAVDPADRVLLRLFEQRGGVLAAPSHNGTASGLSPHAAPGAGAHDAAPSDPFISLEIESLHTGAPLLKRCRFALDVRVTMHLDFESDHEIYIGTVLGGRDYAPASPPKSEKRKAKSEKEAGGTRRTP